MSNLTNRRGYYSSSASRSDSDSKTGLGSASAEQIGGSTRQGLPVDPTDPSNATGVRGLARDVPSNAEIISGEGYAFSAGQKPKRVSFRVDENNVDLTQTHVWDKNEGFDDWEHSRDLFMNHQQPYDSQ